MEGGRISSVSISPNFLCLSLGTWSIEASYHTAAKQKFKTSFDVKEYGEQGVAGRVRRNTPETGLKMERRSHGTPVCQGPSWVLVNRTVCSSPWGLPASPGTKWDSEGKRGNGEMLRSTAFTPPSAPIF